MSFYFIKINLSWLSYTCITLIALLSVFKQYKTQNNYVFYIFIWLTLISLGFFNGSLNNSFNFKSYFTKHLTEKYVVKLVASPIEKENSYQLTVYVNQAGNNLANGKSLIYVEKNENSKKLSYGDVLSVKANFSPIIKNGNPYEFDYKRYLKIHDIHHQAYIDKSQWEIIKTGDKSLLYYTNLLRHYFDEILTKSSLNEKNKKVAKALLLGEKEYLDDELLRSYSSAGAMHVLAVSGLHVGIIMLILQFIFKPLKFNKNGAIFYTIIILTGLWLYALITGFSPSVIRASIMFSFIVSGKNLQRETSIYQSILVSAFIILIFDPFSLFKVGFQLSYLAVIGIVYIQPKLYRLYYFKYKLPDYIWKITTVSIAAQLATFPLGLYYFHQFPNLFLISNLIVIPSAIILLSLGCMYFAFHFISPLKYVFEMIMDWVISFLNYSVSFIEQIPFSIYWGISISWIETITIYAILIALTFGLTLKNYKLITTGFTLIILFITYQILDEKSMSSKKHCVVYNIKNDFAMDVFYGTNNYFIGTKSLLNNESKLLFHIKHNWFKYRGEKLPQTIKEYDSLMNPTLFIGEKKWLIINHKIDKIFVSDYVILEQSVFINEGCINFWKNNGTRIILHPNLNYKTKSWILKKYPNDKIYDIKERGAFIVDF